MIAAILVFFQITTSPEPIPSLDVGQVVHSEIGPKDPVTRTRALDEDFTPIPTRSKLFLIRVPSNGSYRFVMKSRYFDTYLVLRNSKGELLAEDDDGWVPAQSQLGAELRHGETYSLYACAMHGGVGAFELSFLEGKPAPPSAEDLAVWSEDPRTTATTVRYQARDLLNTNQIAGVKELFEKALVIAENGLGEETQETAACLYDLGRHYLLFGEVEKARKFLDRAIKVQEKLLGSKDIQTCDSYEELANVWIKAGDHSKGANLRRMALEGFESHLGAEETRIDYEVPLRCAVASVRLGEFSKGEIYYRRCLSLAEKVFGGESPQFANNLAMLGSSLVFQGKWASAGEYCERAIDLLEKNVGFQRPLLTQIRTHLAMVRSFHGDLPGAKRILEFVLRDSRPNRRDPEIIHAIFLLGQLCVASGDLEHARALFEEVTSLVGEASGGVNFCNAYLAYVELEALNLAKARKNLETALEMVSKIPSNAVGPCLGPFLSSLLGQLQFLEGNYESAQRSFQDWIEQLPGCAGSFDSARALPYQSMARMFLEKGDLQRSWVAAHHAYMSTESELRNGMWVLPEHDRYRFERSQRVGLDFLLDLSERDASPQAIEVTFDALTRWKARVFEGMLSSKQRLFQSHDKTALDVLDQLQQVQSRLSALVSFRFFEQSLLLAPKIEELQKERVGLEKKLQKLIGQNEKSAPVHWKELQEALPDQSTLINFIEHRRYIPSTRIEGVAVKKAGWGQPEISAWILAKNSKHPVRVLLGPSAEVDKLTRDFVGEIVVERTGFPHRASEMLVSLNQKVLDKIWLPLASHIEGDFVVLSTDGCLGSLPFAAVKGKDGRYLIEKFRFVYLQDVMSIPALRAPRVSGEASLLTVGGVDFDNKGEPEIDGPGISSSRRGGKVVRNQPWRPIPLSAEEGSSVIGLHEKLKPNQKRLFLGGRGATEASLKEALSKYSLVHIASHGFFDPDAFDSVEALIRMESPGEHPQMLGFQEVGMRLSPGLLSGIVCAGANRPALANGEDGLLTAEEVGWIDLSKCELVVLSACETGLGTVQGGEGMIGLRSALRQAGARAVISSLWSVGDRSTLELMSKFYSILFSSKTGPLEALRDAQLQILSMQRKKFKGRGFPYAWGAFVLDGDWR